MSLGVQACWQHHHRGRVGHFEGNFMAHRRDAGCRQGRRSAIEAATRLNHDRNDRRRRGCRERRRRQRLSTLCERSAHRNHQNQQHHAGKRLARDGPELRIHAESTVHRPGQAAGLHVGLARVRQGCRTFAAASFTCGALPATWRSANADWQQLPIHLRQSAFWSGLHNENLRETPL